MDVKNSPDLSNQKKKSKCKVIAQLMSLLLQR